MRTALCLLLLACGSASKSATTTNESSDCEPGRCLEDISKAVAEHKPAARKCAASASGRVIINFKTAASKKPIKGCAMVKSAILQS